MNIRLTRIQFFMIIFTIITGFVYITIQSYIIDYGRRASWLIFIVVSIIVFFVIMFYEKNYQYFVLGKVTSTIYLVYWLVHISISVAYIIYLISTWMSPNTPVYALLMIVLLPSLYASLSRPETAINLGAPFGIFIIVFVVFILNGSKEFYLSNLFPIEESGWKEWMWGSIYSFNAFRNLECYLLFRRYVMKNEKVNGLPLVLFFIGLFLMYFFSIVTVMMYFSIDEFKLVSEPILYLLHAQEVTFAKRLDLIFVFIWVLISILTVINFMLAARLLRFSDQKKMKKQKMQIVAYHFIIFGGAYFLSSYERIDFVVTKQWVSFFIFGLFLPLVIIFWNKIRGRTIYDSSN